MGTYRASISLHNLDGLKLATFCRIHPLQKCSVSKIIHRMSKCLQGKRYFVTSAVIKLSNLHLDTTSDIGSCSLFAIF